MLQTKRFNSISRSPRRSATPGPPAAADRRQTLFAIAQPHGLDWSSTHATLADVEPVHVTLSGDLTGDYVVEDHRPDGRVVLRPDLSVEAMLARYGERKLTPEKLEQHFGGTRTDEERQAALQKLAGYFDRPETAPWDWNLLSEVKRHAWPTR